MPKYFYPYCGCPPPTNWHSSVRVFSISPQRLSDITICWPKLFTSAQRHKNMRGTVFSTGLYMNYSTIWWSTEETVSSYINLSFFGFLFGGHFHLRQITNTTSVIHHSLLQTTNGPLLEKAHNTWELKALGSCISHFSCIFFMLIFILNKNRNNTGRMMSHISYILSFNLMFVYHHQKLVSERPDIREFIFLSDSGTNITVAHIQFFFFKKQVKKSV